MLKNRKSVVCVLTALTGGLAAPAVAQSHLDIGPLVGFYAPAGSFKPAPYYSTGLPTTPSNLSGVAWGAQGRIWLTPRWGLQLQLAAASSSVGGGATPGGLFPPTPAQVFTASGQVLFKLISFHGAQAWCSGGPGLIRHGGTAYSRYGSPTQFATTLGLASAIPLGHRLSIDLGVTTFLYNLDVSDSVGTSLEHGFQVDPLLHLGLGLRWP